MRALLNKLFKNIAEDTSKIKNIKPFIETDQSSGAKDEEVIDASRRNFFRQMTNVGIGVGVVGQQNLQVKDLTPPKDPLVEELTRRVEEQERLLKLQNEAMQNMQAISRPFYGSMFSCSTHAFSSFADIPFTIAHNPTNLRKM